jgi:hypothetical protein
MKTSNILIITYLFVIFGGMAVLCIDEKMHFAKLEQTQQIEMKKNQMHQTNVDLPPFSAIVDTVGHKFSITTGEEPRLAVVCKDDATEMYDIEVRNDTLYINRVESGAHLTIVCKDVLSVVAKKCEWINMCEASFKTLNLNITKSNMFITNVEIGLFRFYLYDETSCNASKIKVKVLDGYTKNSHYEAYDSKVTSFSSIKTEGDHSLDQSTVIY